MTNAQDNPDWEDVKRILIIRLRSIGDSVLSTPAISLIKERFPGAKIDFLLEDWVAPLFDSHPLIHRTIISPKTTFERIGLAREIRKKGYDLVLNFHGGTTAGFLTAFSGAKHRVGSVDYQYSFLYSRLSRHPHEIFGRTDVHSAEQQAALLDALGFDVRKVPGSVLEVTESDVRSVAGRLTSDDISDKRFAVIHPLAAYASKTWSAANFAKTVDLLDDNSIRSVILVTPDQLSVAQEIAALSDSSPAIMCDLPLSQVPALTSRATVFIGNDSGIAHIAAATSTPTLVIFGSSNPVHWRPWTDAPSRIVRNDFDCQPCPGDKCRVFGNPRCIEELTFANAVDSIDSLLKEIDH